MPIFLSRRIFEVLSHHYPRFDVEFGIHELIGRVEKEDLLWYPFNVVKIKYYDLIVDYNLKQVLVNLVANIITFSAFLFADH